MEASACGAAYAYAYVHVHVAPQIEGPMGVFARRCKCASYGAVGLILVVWVGESQFCPFLAVVQWHIHHHGWCYHAC